MLAAIGQIAGQAADRYAETARNEQRDSQKNKKKSESCQRFAQFLHVFLSPPSFLQGSGLRLGRKPDAIPGRGAVTIKVCSPTRRLP